MSATDHDSRPGSDRRSFLSVLSRLFMGGGLVAGYGACGAAGVRYLFPPGRRGKRWQFVSRVDGIRAGSSLEYRAPTGERIAVARRAESGTVDDFVALSSTCPHLGCQVHWEGQNRRFFCPCHNGVFDPEGKGVSGPPGDAGQDLAQYPLSVRDGLLFIEVPVESVGRPGGESSS